MIAKTDIPPLNVVVGLCGIAHQQLLEALQTGSGGAAHATAASLVTSEQRFIGGRGLPWVDPALHSELLLSREISTYFRQIDARDPVFLSSGTPDVVAFARQEAMPVPLHVERAARLLRYRTHVFVTLPCANTCRETPGSPEQLREHRQSLAIRLAAWLEYGYELVDVPHGLPQERAEFILGLTTQADAGLRV